MNRQNWQVIVVRNQELIAELESEGTRVISNMSNKAIYDSINSRGGKLFYNASCVIFVAIEPTELVAATMDCGIVSQTIALATQAQGLASCICGLARFAFSESKGTYFKEKLNFPTGYEFDIAVLIGESAKATAPHEPDVNKITYID
ncbi:nitroreductase [Clostridia bacterium]|nr:nitroreductase [Clostridia bacterium]